MSLIYNIESPQNNSISKFGIIKVEGWAFSTEEDSITIEVRIGRRHYTLPDMLPREDVTQCHPAFADRALHSGFAYTIELSEKEKYCTHNVSIWVKEGKQKQILGSYIILPETEKAGNIFIRFKGIIVRTANYLKKNKLPKNKVEWALCIKAFKWYFFKHPVASAAENQIKADNFEIWSLKNSIDASKLERWKRETAAFKENPLISIIMPTYNSDLQLLEKAICSVTQQIYENWELCIVDDCSPDVDLAGFAKKFTDADHRIKFFRMAENSHISLTTNYGVQHCNGEYIFLMDHDDMITPNALFEVVKTILCHPDADIIYSDDDKIDMQGKPFDPQFKPDYSPELLLSYMYFSHIFVIRKSLYLSVGGERAGYEGSQDYDLALRLTEKTSHIIHIPKILYHWRAAPNSTASSAKEKPYSLINGMKAVSDAVVRRNIPARVYSPDFAEKANLGIFALKYNSNEYPLVSIIIPSKNHKEILERCISSISKLSTYPNYEIVIVDNDSDDESTLKYLGQLPHKIVKGHNPGNQFNFSRMVNIGVANSNGNYIILLNNDTEVIEPCWIENMLAYMLIDGVGAVGAKLLYSDHRVQHAGVVLHMFNGIAGHAFKLIPDDNGGYLSYANVARNYSAVTAACIMTSRAIYDSVGGFDEEHYAVSFNDVDFCLRIREAGGRIVYNPAALLHHHEGVSRGVEQTGYYSDAQEEYNFVTKWLRDGNGQDPYYNPNLSYENELFEVECNNVISGEHRDLRILLITHNLNYEGAPLMQYKIAKYLLSKGYSFDIITCDDGPLRKDYIKLGCNVYTEDVNAVRATSGYAKYEKLLGELAEKYQHLRYDLIYTNTIESFWGVRLGKIMHLPTIWGLHESVDYHKQYVSLGVEYHEEFIRSFRMASKVAFVANATAALYKALNTFNYTTIKNGIDFQKVQAYRQSHKRETVRHSLNIPEGVTVISIMGSVCERKGQLLFVKAAQKVLETHKKTIFQIVGAKESHYLSRIKAFISENAMDNFVRIVNVCDDIFQYYAASDMYVCASYEESSPQVILEAMAFELPIVTTNVFGIPELVRNNQDALLIDPDNENNMADRIIQLMENKPLADRLTKNAFYRVQTFFTIDQMIDGYDKLFQNVFEEGENKVYESYKGIK